MSAYVVLTNSQRSTAVDLLVAHNLMKERAMTHICKHCDEIILGNAYHVTSEEDGIALLDMVVCAECAAEAKRLQLHTREITDEYIEALYLDKQRHRSRLCV